MFTGGFRCLSMLKMSKTAMTMTKNVVLKSIVHRAIGLI